MRTTASIQIRWTLPEEEIIRRLPKSLAFLAPILRDRGPGELTRSEVPAGPSELAEIVRFGSQRIAGQTMFKFARLYDRYDRADLGDATMAELFHDEQLFSASIGEPPQVENMIAAYRGRWDCALCPRVRLEQVRPLKVHPVPGPEVQITDRKQLLLAHRLAPVAVQHGVEVRGLAGRSDYVQVVTPEVVTLHPVFPLIQVDKPCPGCGRVQYNRSDKLEGNPYRDEDNFTLAKEWPLSVRVTDTPAARSRDPMVWGGFIIEGRHQLGEEFDLDDQRSWCAGTHAVFLGMPLLDALLAQGATGLSLRPVRSDARA